MAGNMPPMSRKSSAPWDRLRPVKQDPLESVGYVSKGDSRLLEMKAQESYYNKIVARYMQFCTHHAKSLEAAFASLSVSDSPRNSLGTVKDQPVSVLPPGSICPLTPSPPKQRDRSPSKSSATLPPTPPSPSSELTIILLALRKLREALLATSVTAVSPLFSQRVHVFSIRLAVLALDWQSYFPSLLHLLSVLHTPQDPLPSNEVTEMTTYLLLDMACRQGDYANAYAVLADSRSRHSFQNRNVNDVLDAVVTRNWIKFWRVRRRVDGYERTLMQLAVADMRRDALKAIGRTYMTCDLNWVLHCASGGEMSWEELVKKENVGWSRDGDKVIVRKPKVKTTTAEDKKAAHAGT